MSISKLAEDEEYERRHRFQENLDELLSSGFPEMAETLKQVVVELAGIRRLLETLIAKS